MNTHPDFEELLRLLEEHRVEYMVVGGYAVAFHGYPRFTKDIDVFFQSDDENVRLLRQALMAFGFREEDLPREAFTTPGNVLTFGVVPTRIDLINSIDGVTYEEARRNVVRGAYGEVEVTFIGFEDLIKNKKSTPRAKDKGDVEELLQ
ncbi:MAG: nucleotidyltransferase [Planctomycetes bacterium]|nr:nucleotidyltransferase [Planctomycetota bacterium]